jgi:hypothetical protein
MLRFTPATVAQDRTQHILYAYLLLVCEENLN